MATDTSAQAEQMCHSCGGAAPVDLHFCPQCTKILTLRRQGDYFSFLGVPRRLNLNLDELERQFRVLSRQFHPDYFYNASSAERLASLERSSYLNDAYRTLRNPVSRTEYLLSLEGLNRRRAERQGHAPSENDTVPAALLEEVFALNEELEEVRQLRAAGASRDEWQGRLKKAEQPIEAKRAEHDARMQELSASWDALSESGAPDDQRAKVLEALRERMLERNYINNLLNGIQRELN